MGQASSSSQHQRGEHHHGAPTSTSAGAPPVIPDEWSAAPDPEAAITHAVPHAVVSQILRPDVAAFLPPNVVKMKTRHDAQCCITSMTLARAPATSDVYEFAAGLPNLTAVSALRVPGDVSEVSQITKLRKLSLGYCKVVCGVFFTRHLVKLINLRELALSECPGMDARAFEAIAALSLLEMLALSDCNTLDGEGFRHLSRLSHLRKLNIHKTHFADGMGGVASMTQLEDLSVSACRGISMDDFARLHDLPQLRAFCVSWCREVDTSDLELISKFPALDTLCLSGCCNVDEHGLQHLSTMQQLTSLDLIGCSSVHGSALPVLANAPQLRRLAIAAHCISDKESVETEGPRFA